MKGLNPTNIKPKLDYIPGKSTPSSTTTKYWVTKYTQDHTCQDGPNEVTTPEMVKKIHKASLDESRLKVHELADTWGISKKMLNIAYWLKITT